MSAITAKASRKMKKYAVLTREPRCFLGSFDFSWEQRKLGDCFTERVESMPDGELISVTINDGIKKFSELGRHDNSNDDKSKYKKVCIGDIAYNSMRMWQGASGYSPYEGIVSPAYTVLSPNSGINSKCLAYQFKLPEMIHTFQINSQGITSDNWNLKYPALSEIEIFVSRNEKEQAKISEYFEGLDRLITLHQRKCVFLFGFFQAFISMIFTASTFSWEQRKLTEFVEFFSGLTYTPNDVQENGTLVLRSSNVSNGEVVDADNIYVNPQVVNSENVKVGDIVVVVRNGSRSLIGKHAQIKAFMPNTVIGAFMTGIRSECPEFTNALLNTSRFEEEIAMNMGATINQITGYMFSKMEFKVPCLDEQKKIGEYFEKLDHLITLHQRECISFTARAGRLILTANKKRNTSSWEQRKLGDMMNVTSVKRIHQSDWTDSGVRFLRARDIVAAAKNEEPDDYLYISKEKYEEYSALSGKVGVSDLLVTGVGTIGVPYLVRNLEPLYFKDGNIIWFQNSDKIDGKFLFYSFSAEQIQGFINESAGIGTVGTYTIESGKKTPISLPNQIEQAKVGEFFQQLDNLITLHQRKPFLMKWRTSDANRNQTNRLVL